MIMCTKTMNVMMSWLLVESVLIDMLAYTMRHVLYLHVGTVLIGREIFNLWEVHRTCTSAVELVEFLGYL